MRKCSLDKIQSLFAKIAENAKLYMPIDNADGTASYGEWSQGVEWSNQLNTTKSPKDFFFPQTEDLMKFKTEGKNIDVIDVRKEIEEFVVFGVRACDVKSFEILDRVFLTEPRDSFYAMKREKGIIIALACTKPAETCFCKTFGVSPEEPEGDITTWKTDSEIFFKANTEKGEVLLVTSDVSEAIHSAYENNGVVVDSQLRYIFQRARSNSQAVLSKLTVSEADKNGTAIAKCISIMLAREDSAVGVGELMAAGQNPAKILADCLIISSSSASLKCLLKDI